MSDDSATASISCRLPQPVGTLPPQPWMTAPQTRTVIEALAKSGAEVRFIGGCVRDAILKRPVQDIDIAVPMPPEDVMALLAKAGIRVIPTGIDHGTVTAVIDRMVFEITSLRVDVETDGRRAKVAFTDSWEADAARRDFTFNAFSCSPDGAIYDYFGGLEDLGHGRVRFVGDPRERITEDRLRLLRFFRFFALYGRPPADVDALEACREHAHGLQLLSGERVRVEIFRTLMAGEPADVFELMQFTDVLEHVLPEAGKLPRLRLLTWLDTRALRVSSVAPDPIRRLAAMLNTDAAGATQVAERLRLSNRQRRRLVALSGPEFVIEPGADDRLVRRALHHLGPDVVRDLALLNWADELTVTPRPASDRTRGWIGLVEAVDSWRPLSFQLRGRDVLALGIAHGPQVGDLLAAVEAWWEGEDYRPDRDACLARLRSLVGADAGSGA